MNELDELRLRIAKAKGWRYCEFGPSEINGSKPPKERHLIEPEWVLENEFWTMAELSEWPSLESMTDVHGTPISIPDWPRDIAAAWELVEEMRGHGFGLCEPEPVDGAPKSWCCNLYIDGAGTIAEAYADNAPEAIARCWLAWKEAQG